MTIQDIPAGDIAKIYDELQARQPLETARLRVVVRTEQPGLSTLATKRRVVWIFLGDREEYRSVKKLLSERRPEPMRSSPLEQIKGLTANLNPKGEQTGGNFRADF